MSWSQRLLPWAIGFALLTMVGAMAASNMRLSVDLFHEMALFRQILDDGKMPLTDSFAYTPTRQRVVHHEWGTGAVLYWVLISTGWGAAGLIGLKYVLSFSICIGCYLYARWRDVSLTVFAMMSLIAMSVGGWIAFTNVRAQVFTLLFFVATLFLIELDRRGKRWWIWLWLPMFVVWANLHAGVVSGVGVLATYGLACLIDAFAETRSVTQTLNRVKHLLLVGVSIVLLINVNPYGTDYLPYLVRAIRMDRPMIPEWRPIWQVGVLSSQVTFLFSIGIAIYAIVVRPTRSTFETMVLMLTGYMAMKHYRHVSLYAITWLCLVPPMLDTTKIGDAIKTMFQKRAPQFVVVSLVCGLVAIGYTIEKQGWQLNVPTDGATQARGMAVYPVGAIEYLGESEFEGNLFVAFEMGGYASWHLYPKVKVSLDSRYEVAYPDGAAKENWDVFHAKQGWEKKLAQHGTDAVLVPCNKPLFDVLEQEAIKSSKSSQPSPWSRVYKDNGFAIFVRAEKAVKMSIVERDDYRLSSFDVLF